MHRMYAYTTDIFMFLKPVTVDPARWLSLYYQHGLPEKLLHQLFENTKGHDFNMKGRSSCSWLHIKLTHDGML